MFTRVFIQNMYILHYYANAYRGLKIQILGHSVLHTYLNFTLFFPILLPVAHTTLAVSVPFLFFSIVSSFHNRVLCSESYTAYTTYSPSYHYTHAPIFPFCDERQMLVLRLQGRIILPHFFVRCCLLFAIYSLIPTMKHPCCISS